jgi:hypothetical protein
MAVPAACEAHAPPNPITPTSNAVRVFPRRRSRRTIASRRGRKDTKLCPCGKRPPALPLFHAATFVRSGTGFVCNQTNRLDHNYHTRRSRNSGVKIIAASRPNYVGGLRPRGRPRVGGIPASQRGATVALSAPPLRGTPRPAHRLDKRTSQRRQMPTRKAFKGHAVAYHAYLDAPRMRCLSPLRKRKHGTSKPEIDSPGK